MSSAFKHKWEEAIQDELRSLAENNTWEVRDMPKNSNRVSTKWIFKIKRDEYGNITKFKARLVARGFTQKEGIDYDQVFAPVAAMATLRTMVAMAAVRNQQLYQYDVSTAFLNGHMDHTVWIEPPKGTDIALGEGQGIQLAMALYGTKQGARQWNIELDRGITSLGWRQSPDDPCLYKHSDSGSYLCAYVDDILLAADDSERAREFEIGIKGIWNIGASGAAAYFLGMHIKISDYTICVSQEKYIDNMVERFKQTEAKPTKIPMTVDKSLSGTTVTNQASHIEN